MNLDVLLSIIIGGVIFALLILRGIYYKEEAEKWMRAYNNLSFMIDLYNARDDIQEKIRRTKEVQE